jgi:hypothetical protein
VRRAKSTVAVVGGAALLLGVGWLAADTLVLEDGRRISGELVRVDGDSVEFREQGLFSGKLRRFDRDDVRTIELEGHRRSGDQDRDRDRTRDRGDHDRGDRSGGRSGMREREVGVGANVAWTDTGIDVRSGQNVFFQSSGQVRWGKDRKDGPQGEGGNHYNPNRPIPNRPAAALIGKVGQNSRDFFFIGSDEGPFRIRDSGRLYLGINDDYLLDNSGAFRVVVSY